MTTKPTAEELVEIRKKLKKNKLPNLFSGMWASEPGIGGFRVSNKNSDFEIEWVLADLKSKNALFSDLCNNKDKEEVRLELGWLVADLMDHHAGKMYQIIPGPNEAMKEAEYFHKMASTWRHWAQVPAGHMILD
jgi:hypothetical protein